MGTFGTRAHYNFGSQDCLHTHNFHALTCSSTARERLHTLTLFTQLSYTNSPPRLKRSLYALKTFTATGDAVDTAYTHTRSAAHVHSHIFTHICESQDRKWKDVFTLRFPTGSHSSHTGQQNFLHAQHLHFFTFSQYLYLTVGTQYETELPLIHTILHINHSQTNFDSHKSQPAARDAPSHTPRPRHKQTLPKPNHRCLGGKSWSLMTQTPRQHKQPCHQASPGHGLLAA